MNKIVLVNGKIKEEPNNPSIEIEEDTLKISVLSNTDLNINWSGETSLNVYITLAENVTLNLYEQKNNGVYKISYTCNLNRNSKINVFKIHDTDTIDEQATFNLKGEKAAVNYHLKTISKDKETYSLLVYHEASNTESHIKNSGVNIKEGNLTFEANGFVPNGIKGCTVKQNNRIVNLTDNHCEINPNLYISENDVIANHSAYIGKFSSEEIFYLMSRGLTYKEAEDLLIKGFLLNETNNKEEIENILNKYWR